MLRSNTCTLTVEWPRKQVDSTRFFKLRGKTPHISRIDMAAFSVQDIGFALREGEVYERQKHFLTKVFIPMESFHIVNSDGFWRGFYLIEEKLNSFLRCSQ